MCASSCLVTSIPEFRDEEQSTPLLLTETAFPDNRTILLIDSAAGKQVFQAEVTSANDKGEDIEVRLIVDYGVPFSPNPKSYFSAQITQNNPIPAEVEPDQPRQAVATWYRGQPALTGCHTFTLMISHQFDDATGCPEKLSDSSELTWVAYVCDPNDPECGIATVDLSSCPKPTKSCPESPDDVGGSGGGAP